MPPLIVCLRCGQAAATTPCAACTPRGRGSTARGYTYRWQQLSARVLREERGMCHICGRPGADTADHVIPKRAGGTDDRDNLRAAHRSCNASKGAGYLP